MNEAAVLRPGLTQTHAQQPPLALLPSCLLCVGVREHGSLASMSNSSTSILSLYTSACLGKQGSTSKQWKKKNTIFRIESSRDLTKALMLVFCFLLEKGSCSWPLTLKIIGFICTELFSPSYFSPEAFNISWQNGDSSMFQTYEVCPRQEVLSHLLLTLLQCNRLLLAALLLHFFLKSYSDLPLSFLEKEAF